MWFNLKFAEEIAVEFAQKLFGKSNWESALESLANLWLHNQEPTFAYAYVVEVDYPGYTKINVAANMRDNGKINL